MTMEEIQSILRDYKEKGNICITQGGLGTYPNDNNPLFYNHCKKHNEDSDDD